MHNQIASTVSLAKATLLGLNRNSHQTVIATPTLELLLNTLINLGERDNQTARKIESTSAAFVASRISGVESR